MDSKKIIDRINNPHLLKEDSSKDWNELTDKHPYFPVGQLLQFGNDYFQEKDNIHFTALYKSDPIEFANYVNSLKRIENNNIISEIKIEKPISNNEKIVVEEFKKTLETPIEISPNIEVKEDPNQTEPLLSIKLQTIEEQSSKEPEILETISESKNEINKKLEQVENEIKEIEKIIENSVVEPTEKEDILAMINDLPTNLILEEKPSILEAKNETIDEETNLTDEEKRQKALMVMMSFTDWLNHFKSKTEKEQIEEQEKKALKTAWQKEKLTAIIEEEQDEIPETIFKQAMESISMENALISESLAEILAKQGKTDKAIEMYKKLSLRNPEKNSYFADRIKDLLTNNI